MVCLGIEDLVLVFELGLFSVVGEIHLLVVWCNYAVCSLNCFAGKRDGDLLSELGVVIPHLDRQNVTFH